MKHRITRSTIAPRNAPLGLLYTHVGKHRTLQRATEGNRTLTRSLGSCCATTTPQSRKLKDTHKNAVYSADFSIAIHCTRLRGIAYHFTPKCGRVGMELEVDFIVPPGFNQCHADLTSRPFSLAGILGKVRLSRRTPGSVQHDGITTLDREPRSPRVHQLNADFAVSAGQTITERSCIDWMLILMA